MFHRVAVRDGADDDVRLSLTRLRLGRKSMVMAVASGDGGDLAAVGPDHRYGEHPVSAVGALSGLPIGRGHSVFEGTAGDRGNPGVLTDEELAQ